jgi:serine/threonine protein kinase
MSDLLRPDESLAQRLPLPLAQQYRRAANAKTTFERHLAAYYFWEAGLKLLASVAVVEYAALGRPDPQLNECLKSLARPAIGHWWEFVRKLVPVLADAGDPGFRDVRDLVLGRTRDDLPYAAGLDVALVEALEGKSPKRATVRLTELFDRLVSYRNREIGHGAAGQRPPAHYDRLGRALFSGVAQLFDRLDVLAGRSLQFIGDVRRQADGSWLADRYELKGEAARRIEAKLYAEADTAVLPKPGRIYLQEARAGGTAVLRELHPLLTYQPDSGQVFYLNSRRGKRQTDFISYEGGELRLDLVADQQELLAQVLGLSVDGPTAERWAATSLAEETATPAAEEPAAQRTLGDFELLSKLGQGGMGAVYRAWQPSLGRQVALKCLHHLGDAKAEARFAREIRALGRVEHAHLVRIFTSGSDGDQWFYAMELVEGPTLAAVCDKLSSQLPNPTVVDWPKWTATVSTACRETHEAEKPLGSLPLRPTVETLPVELAKTGPEYVQHVVGLVRQVAEAAHALHEAGVVHRDIKPGNVMLTPDGMNAVLTDLGLAQLTDEVNGKLTKTRQFVGTLRYASPEQVLAAGPVDRRSDIYSLGVTLWELLTLRPIYGATEQTPTPELMQRIQYAEPELPRRCNRRVPRDLDAVVMKCLEKDPGRRYATAAELAEDLRRVQHGEAVRARKIGVVRSTVRKVRRRPGRTAVVCGALLLVVAAAFGLWHWDAHYRQKVEYFVTWSKRWGAVHGAGPLTDEQVRHRARSYRITRRGDRVEKVECVNGQGRRRPLNLSLYMDDIFNGATDNLTFTWELERDDKGQVVREIGRDQDGEVLWTFQFTSTSPPVGHFTDRNGFPRARSGAGASHVRIERNQQGFETAVQYLNADGAPQPGKDGSSGFSAKLDSRGLPLEMQLVDEQGRPKANRRGLSRVVVRRDDWGNVVEWSAWNLDGQPIAYEAGVARNVRSHDAYGNQIAGELYGADGRLALGTDGWARLCNRYDDAGNPIEQWYEDALGRLVRNKIEGVARLIGKFDEHGNQIEVAYYDEHGKPARDSNGVARITYQYDDHDRPIETRYFDVNGQPKLNKHGVAGFANAYDARGRKIGERFFDEQNQPAWTKDGFVSWQASFDDRDNESERAFFGADGSLTRTNLGYARRTSEYDRAGKRLVHTTWDEKGRLISNKDGYAIVRSAYNERGELAEESYFGEFNEPVRHQDGFARKTMQHDSFGRLVEVAYWDEQKRPALYGSAGNASFRRKHDERGNVIQESYLDKDRKPMRLSSGYARIDYELDERGNKIAMTYWGVQGQPAQHRNGYFRIRFGYDERDRLIENSYRDKDDQPVAHALEGHVRDTLKYDELDQIIERAYFDKNGNLTRRKDEGYARFTRGEHDARGNVTEEAYWDENGRLIRRLSSGFARMTFKYDERDHRIQERYWDEQGRPTGNPAHGTAIVRVDFRFDDRGNKIEQTYWDANDKPALHADGNAGFRARYNDRDRLLEMIFLGPGGGKIKTKLGARQVMKYDERGNQIEGAYLDEQDAPMRGPEGWARRARKYDRDTPIETRFFDIDGKPLRQRVVIERVAPNGQAAALGLRPGDVFLIYDRQEVADMLTFVNRRKSESAQDPPRELRVRRGDETITVMMRPGLMGVVLNDKVDAPPEK